MRHPHLSSYLLAGIAALAGGCGDSSTEDPGASAAQAAPAIETRLRWLEEGAGFVLELETEPGRALEVSLPLDTPDLHSKRQQLNLPHALTTDASGKATIQIQWGKGDPERLVLRERNRVIQEVVVTAPLRLVHKFNPPTLECVDDDCKVILPEREAEPVLRFHAPAGWTLHHGGNSVTSDGKTSAALPVDPTSLWSASVAQLARTADGEPVTSLEVEVRDGAARAATGTIDVSASVAASLATRMLEARTARPAATPPGPSALVDGAWVGVGTFTVIGPARTVAEITHLAKLMPVQRVIATCGPYTDAAKTIERTLDRMTTDLQATIIDLATGQEVARELWQGSSPPACPRKLTTIDGAVADPALVGKPPANAPAARWVEAQLARL